MQDKTLSLNYYYSYSAHWISNSKCSSQNRRRRRRQLPHRRHMRRTNVCSCVRAPSKRNPTPWTVSLATPPRFPSRSFRHRCFAVQRRRVWVADLAGRIAPGEDCGIRMGVYFKFGEFYTKSVKKSLILKIIEHVYFI